MTGAADLVIEAQAWHDLLPDLDRHAESAVAAALRAGGLDPAVCEVAVLACDDARIRALNADFRGRDTATNVLSWPAFELAAPAPGQPPPMPPPPPAGGRLALGDVAIAHETVVREAQIRSVALKSHVIHLILHGTLHCLGYDHDDDKDAVLMEGIERRALAGLGIDDPYGFDPDAAALPASDR